MSTLLYTVLEDDLVELAISVMDWKNIHHLPVENASGELSGLLTSTDIKKMNEENLRHEGVADIMTRNVITSGLMHAFRRLYK